MLATVRVLVEPRSLPLRVNDSVRVTVRVEEEIVVVIGFYYRQRLLERVRLLPVALAPMRAITPPIPRAGRRRRRAPTATFFLLERGFVTRRPAFLGRTPARFIARDIALPNDIVFPLPPPNGE